MIFRWKCYTMMRMSNADYAEMKKSPAVKMVAMDLDCSPVRAYKKLTEIKNRYGVPFGFIVKQELHL